jgi:phosphoribosylformylglycinamidine synthase
MLWEVDIYPAEGEIDRTAQRIAADAVDLGLGQGISLRAARGYLLQGEFQSARLERIARQILTDDVVERSIVGQLGDQRLEQSPAGHPQLVHVLFKPGVMDPVADTAQQMLSDLGEPVEAVRTLRKYWFKQLPQPALQTLCQKLLANDSIEHVVYGPLRLERLAVGAPYQFALVRVPLRELDDEALMHLSRKGQLYLSLAEMKTIQDRFREMGRDPTDVELETLAQTWSEHCSHKTLAGRISYRDENGQLQFDNMLKETIFAATHQIREQLGSNDWCVSVFKDNAGVVRFDDEYNVVFKVETHNHPSAIEPYGGANTGIGGVIRDPLGTGRGAKPICNTDVFCFARPDTSNDELPPGVLHPRRVMKGVVAGVRDYGNRMGIPTVNGAIFFDQRYLGNPLVYCGNVGLLPRDKSTKAPQAGDYIVVIGGRTGRDGIHGATFSSAELTSESETVSGGAVQIGNAITEKMVLDVLLSARDRNLFHAVTDCGAGGFSSAIGEMGEHIGAEVWLDRAPLKYAGLSYTEIWISEAQERMVLSIAPAQWEEFYGVCAREGVEATILGRFVPTGRLQLYYHGTQVGDLDMQLLHNGRPPGVREAYYRPNEEKPQKFSAEMLSNYGGALRRLLGSYNIASKEWVVRQYDHEVQGGSVIKPLVGVANDGPSDAAVIRPRLESYRGLAISCALNPRYGDIDTYAMAASAIDEAIRNCVAVGADPTRIAILDNFCWGYTDRPETLGSLVRAALACRDTAVALGTPFISGKDSLNNEFSYEQNGHKTTIAIPSTLLISALGIVHDVRQCVSMDAKTPGNLIFLVGLTRNELGGSHFAEMHQLEGGFVPRVDTDLARKTFLAVHAAIQRGTVRACHDPSEGGLAVAAAEMAFAGGCGMDLDLSTMVIESNQDLSDSQRDAIALFSESNSRLLCEVPADREQDFRRILADVPCAKLGRVTDGGKLLVRSAEATLIREAISELKEAWQSPLRWS